MVGDALAGDVEGGAVVDGGTDDGEAEGYVYGVGEGYQFDGDVSLVVVHGDDAVEIVVEGAVEQGVAGKGTGYVPPLNTGPFYSGFEGDGVFFSEEAVFTGVGVSNTRSSVSLSGTSCRAIWVVAWMTFSRSETSIMR